MQLVSVKGPHTFTEASEGKSGAIPILEGWRVISGFIPCTMRQVIPQKKQKKGMKNVS
jgi:hypothetical protein